MASCPCGQNNLYATSNIYMIYTRYVHDIPLFSMIYNTGSMAELRYIEIRVKSKRVSSRFKCDYCVFYSCFFGRHLTFRNIRFSSLNL